MSLTFIIYGSVALSGLAILYVIVNLFRLPPEQPSPQSELATEDSHIVPLLDEELKKDLQEKEVLIDDLRVKAERSSSEFSKVREERDSLKVTLTSLRSELDANKDAIAKRVSDATIPLKREIEMLKEERVATQNERREAEQRSTAAEEQAIALKAEIEGMQKSLESTRRTLDQERISYASLSSAIKEKDAVVEDFARKVVAATKDLSKLHSEKASLSEQAETAKREFIATKSSIPKRVSQARVVLQRVINTLKVEREELLHQNDEFNKQLASTNIDIARISKELEDTRRALEAAKRKAEHTVSRKDIAPLKEENVILEGKIQTVRKELAAVYDSIPAKVKNARAALQEELDALKIENADLHSQNAEFDKQVEFFKEESQLLQDSLRDSEQKRSELQGLLADAESSNDFTAKEVEE
jgi:chromosome segregation ATPase